MARDVDEEKGLVKVFWEDVRHKVAKVDSRFVQLIDKLSPDKTFPIYLAYYPYGEMIADTQNLFLPHHEKGVYNIWTLANYVDMAS